jgi:hypothetical protein
MNFHQAATQTTQAAFLLVRARSPLHAERWSAA